MNSAFWTIWLVPQFRNIKCNSSGIRRKNMTGEPPSNRIAIKLVLYILKKKPILSVNSSESEPFSASRPSESTSSAPLSAGTPAFSQPASMSATLPPRMTSLAAVTATSSDRNPAAPTINTESLSQQQTKTSFIDTTSSDVKMQSTESSSLHGESSEAPETKATSVHISFGSKPAVVTKVSSLTPTATSPAASSLGDYQQGLASISATPAAASCIKQAKSSQGISASSPAAVAATSSGRNPAAPSTNTASSQQRRNVSLIDTAASGVKMQSTEGSHLNRKSFGTLAAKATNYQQDMTSFAARSPVASSTNQVKSSYLNSALSAVRTESLGPAATPSGPPATTRLLPSATPSQANVPRDVVPTSSVVVSKVSRHSSLGRVERGLYIVVIYYKIFSSSGTRFAVGGIQTGAEICQPKKQIVSSCESVSTTLRLTVSRKDSCCPTWIDLRELKHQDGRPRRQRRETIKLIAEDKRSTWICEIDMILGPSCLTCDFKCCTFRLLTGGEHHFEKLPRSLFCC